MRKRDLSIYFGPVWAASGLLNFFGEGWPFHKLFKALFRGFYFGGITFIAKTTTLEPRTGNLPLDRDFMPIKRKGIIFHEHPWRWLWHVITNPFDVPDCIYCGPWQWLCGVTLNAVGLSGPGIKRLLEFGYWQIKAGPFQLSIMAVGTTEEERKDEIRRMLLIIKKGLPTFYTKKANDRIAVQVNVSCPNVGYHGEAAKEALSFLDIARDIEFPLPILIKITATMPIEAAKRIAEHEMCSGLVVSNTIPFGHSIIPRWKWRFYFPFGNPLEKYGGGGLSGKPLFPLVCEWIQNARKAGITCHINAGGGIIHPDQVHEAKKARADSISLGSAAMLRPWRIQALIRAAEREFGR